MKVLLYFEGENFISTSGIGRAQKHQIKALMSQGIEYTTDPFDDYDILHINTYGLNSNSMINKARKENKPVIYHAHSTEEDFRNSFILSNQLAPAFKKIIVSLYRLADEIITPTPYSKMLLEGYGIDLPITAISNGIDLTRFQYNAEKVKAYRKYFSLKEDDKVVLSVGLYFERKGLLDFFEVARRLPEYKFIWFGDTPLYSVPRVIREAIDQCPSNVILPGYVKGAIIDGAYLNADCFFFPSNEETEGIVVLEALASKQKVVLRDIGAFDPWLQDKVNCYKGKTIEDFVELVRGSVENTLPNLTEEGYKVAKSRSIENVGKQLKEVYERVLYKK
ncbi:glycosyltransferase [Erysipelotrichaceae bacterium OH741_COT-311]|nr:glycosyltransferase [Erysipelotrichaceae bacterium OH741_COT-311]